MDFVWTHFVVTDLQKLSLGDGVVVVGGGFVFGLVFAWQVWSLCFVDFGHGEPKSNQYLSILQLC